MLLSKDKHRVAASVGLMVLMLFILSTARRFAYPFLPVFMEEFGLSAFAATILVAATQIPAIFGILWGPLGDRFGFRKLMTAGILVMATGFICFAVTQSYFTLLLALFLAGLGKNIYDPNGQACANSNVNRKYRGLVTGVLETGWALSTLVGIPLVTLLVYNFSWRTPFMTLAIAALIMIVLLQLTLPPEKERTAEPIKMSYAYKIAFAAILRTPAIWGLALFFFGVGFANDCIFVVYSRWLDASFGLSYVAVGIGTAIIGAAEMCGELTTAFIAEKVGYKRLFVGVFIIVILATALLPVLGITQSLAWILLFGAFFGAEALIVTGFAFAQDFLPGKRSTILSLVFTATNAGRIAGILSGSGLWALGGMTLVSAFSASALVLALVFLAVLAFRNQNQTL